jgi:anti-sigma regulatory factor (Ser/Thr protein kinase)/anti-anti-sigma regulatory factor
LAGREAGKERFARSRLVCDPNFATQALHVSLAATPAAAHTMRGRLRGWLDQAGVEGPVGFDLVTACSEAFNNAVLHAVDCQPAEVEVDADLVADTVVLSVRDHGGWPDFPAGAAPGHNGYPIMRAFTDSVQVERSEDGTVVTLRRALPPGGSQTRPPQEQPALGGRGLPDVPAGQLLVGIVEAAGVIDADHVDALAGGVRQALSAGAERLLVDLSRTSDITATGINMLLDARQALLPRQGAIAVVLPPRLARLFQTLGLDRRFLLCSGRQQAADLLGLTTPAGTPASHARAA